MHPKMSITAHDLELWVHFQQTQGRSLHCTTRSLRLGQAVAPEKTLIQSQQSHIRAQSGVVEEEVAPTTGCSHLRWKHMHTHTYTQDIPFVPVQKNISFKARQNLFRRILDVGTVKARLCSSNFQTFHLCS